MADYRYTDPEKKEDSHDDLHPTTTVGEGTTRRASIFSQQRRGSITDDVFGEITEDGPNYRAVCYYTRTFIAIAHHSHLQRSDGKAPQC
jgi:hypothetical protein